MTVKTAYTKLAVSIIEKAVDDYVRARKLVQAQIKVDANQRIVDEVKRFFKSSWCNELLTFLDTSLTGKDILETIEWRLKKQWNK